jgi:hypothetical protein
MERAVRSDFRFWAQGDWWGFPFFSLSAGRYFGDKETLCLYWPLGTVVIAGPKVLDFYAGFGAHGATCLNADGEDIKVLNLILSSDSDGASNCNLIRDRKEPVLTQLWCTRGSYGTIAAIEDKSVISRKSLLRSHVDFS